MVGYQTGLEENWQSYIVLPVIIGQNTMKAKKFYNAFEANFMTEIIKKTKKWP